MLGLYVYLPACLIFFSVFLLCFIVFFGEITLICCVLFLQDFADGMCSFNTLVCSRILLLSAVRT